MNVCFAWNDALNEPLSTGVDLGRTFRNLSPVMCLYGRNVFFSFHLKVIVLPDEPSADTEGVSGPTLPIYE